jgi:hypothetical protein
MRLFMLNSLCLAVLLIRTAPRIAAASPAADKTTVRTSPCLLAAGIQRRAGQGALNRLSILSGLVSDRTIKYFDYFIWNKSKQDLILHQQLEQ